MLPASMLLTFGSGQIAARVASDEAGGCCAACLHTNNAGMELRSQVAV